MSKMGSILQGSILVFSLSMVATPAPLLAADPFPDTISLPDGWQPEGVVVGRGTALYAGSLANGAIFRADLHTGEGTVLVEGAAGRVAVGLAHDPRSDLLYVAGGPTGVAPVYDAGTGALIAVLQLTTGATFVNDAIVARDAVYFTDSFRPVLYRVELLPGGRLPDEPSVTELPLGGDFQFIAGAFNANGIEVTPRGDLIVVNSTVGALYLVDPATGDATLIDLGGASVASGDGLLLQGRTLYVVQNALNQIAVVELDASFTSGTVTRVITDARFDVPTTAALFGNMLYVANARFGTPPTPTTTYTVVAVRR